MYLVQSKQFFSSSTRSSLDSTIGGVKKGNKTLDLLGGMFWVSKNKIKREYSNYNLTMLPVHLTGTRRHG